MIRVLHVVNWIRRGGVETQLLQLLRFYNREQFHLDVCCYGREKGYLAPKVEALGSEVLSCQKSANLSSFSKRFAELITERKYDVVHCHSEAWSGPVLRGAKCAGVPVRIAHIRSSLPQGFTIQNPLLKFGRNLVVVWGRYWLSRYASHILGVSEASLNARFRQWKEKENCSLWTLGVDIKKYNLADAKNDSEQECPGIINVGSFIPQRRHDLLLRIHSHVIEKLPLTKMIIAGDGECLERSRALAKKLGIHDRVEFLGLREDIPEVLRRGNVFVTCSEAEGLPNALLEAQASGLPIVASDIPPHRECLPKTVHPFLFQHDSIRTAADKIVRILKEPKLYNRLSKAGREHVCKHYDSRKNLPKLEEMYLKWVEERRRSEISGQRTGML